MKFAKQLIWNIIWYKFSFYVGMNPKTKISTLNYKYHKNNVLLTSPAKNKNQDELINFFKYIAGLGQKKWTKEIKFNQLI